MRCRGPALTLSRAVVAARPPLAVRRMSGMSAIASAAASRRPLVAVVASPDNPALACKRDDLADLIIGTSVDELGPRLSEAEALLFVPPSSPKLCVDLWDGGRIPNVRWVHCFYAGVDSLAPLLQGPLSTGRGAEVPVSNGRGAFSSSLAEYALAAALHFTKQVPRCLRNRAEGRWDKFVMAELRGKTLGLAGFGDIAKATAKLAKAFGMRVVALRRNAGKSDAADVDLVVGPYDGALLLL